MKQAAVVVVCLLVIAGTGVSIWREVRPRHRAFSPHAPDPFVDVAHDVVYGEPDGERLRMEIARPNTSPGPFPAVIVIHGGGWGAPSMRPPEVEWMMRLARAGYVAAAIQHRYSPAYRFPAQVEDAKCAVRYLRSHAGEWGIHPDRIGVMGYSAGGHLALMVGMAGEDPGLEGDGGWPGVSSSVQAVVNFCGPADMSLVREGWIDVAYVQFLGGEMGERTEVYRRASPVNYATPDDPPILSFYGTYDDIVPYAHGLHLDAACRAAGSKHDLVTMYGRGHGRDAWTHEPAIRFLDFHLKPDSPRFPE